MHKITKPQNPTTQASVVCIKYNHVCVIHTIRKMFSSQSSSNLAMIGLWVESSSSHLLCLLVLSWFHLSRFCIRELYIGCSFQWRCLYHCWRLSCQQALSRSVSWQYATSYVCDWSLLFHSFSSFGLGIATTKVKHASHIIFLALLMRYSALSGTCTMPWMIP